MRIDRFYISPEDRELRQELWVDKPELVHQWKKVLRLKEGSEVILFDGDKHDRLYKVEKVTDDAFKLAHVTDFERKLPARETHLFFSVLKKDKNELIVQKATELGVSRMTPIISDFTQTKTIDEERLKKIIIEASEQSGRSDIPFLHEAMSLNQALLAHKDSLKLYFGHLQENEQTQQPTQSEAGPQAKAENSTGLFIGPEGGWSEADLAELSQAGAKPMTMNTFVLRAETAAITGANWLTAT